MPSIYHWHCTLFTGFFFGVIRLTQRIQFTTSLPSVSRQNKLISGVWVCVCVRVRACVHFVQRHTELFVTVTLKHTLQEFGNLVSLNAFHCFAKHHLCVIFLRNTVSKLTFSMTDNNDRLCLILSYKHHMCKHGDRLWVTCFASVERVTYIKCNFHTLPCNYSNKHRAFYCFRSFSLLYCLH
jgi:hypothetical protein